MFLKMSVDLLCDQLCFNNKLYYNRTQFCNWFKYTKHTL